MMPAGAGSGAACRGLTATASYEVRNKDKGLRLVVGWWKPSNPHVAVAGLGAACADPGAWSG